MVHLCSKYYLGSLSYPCGFPMQFHGICRACPCGKGIILQHCGQVGLVICFASGSDRHTVEWRGSVFSLFPLPQGNMPLLGAFLEHKTPLKKSQVICSRFHKWCEQEDYYFRPLSANGYGDTHRSLLSSCAPHTLIVWLSWKCDHFQNFLFMVEQKPT